LLWRNVVCIPVDEGAPMVNKRSRLEHLSDEYLCEQRRHPKSIFSNHSVSRTNLFFLRNQYAT